MTQIMFNGDYLKLVKELTTVCHSIIFERVGDKIVVKRATSDHNTGFKITAPSDYFTFDGDKLGVADFNGFYQLINSFGISSLHQENNKKIIIKTKTNKINYVLSNPEALEKSPTEIGLSNPDISFNLGRSDIAEISK